MLEHPALTKELAPMNLPAQPLPRPTLPMRPPAGSHHPVPRRRDVLRRWRGPGVALAALGAATLVHAQAYVGLSVGEATTDIGCTGTLLCDRSDTAWKLFGGYLFHPNFGLEASYRDSGRARLSATVGAVTLSDRLRSESVDLYALATAREGALSGFIKAGFATTRARGVATVAGLGSPDTETHTRPAWGLGVGWDFSPTISARVEYERTKVRFGGSDRDVDTWSAGVLTRF
jgi:OOP family OmpA-OmpF porin